MMTNDAETVISVVKSRRITAKPSSIIVRDDESHSGISGVSGTSSKSSVIRARMQKDFDIKFSAQQQLVDQLQADKKLQQKQQDALASQVETLQTMLAKLTQSHPPPSPPTPTVEPPPAHQHPPPTDDVTLDPDFDPTTTDADFQDLVHNYEQRLITSLDHMPSATELRDIGIAAQQLASEACDLDEDPLHSSSNDSEPIHTPSRLKKGTTNFFDSEDASTTTPPPKNGKRMAATDSDEISNSENVFHATTSLSPKKKAHVTGDADPGSPT